MDKLFGDLKGFFKTGKCIIDSFIFRLHYRFTLVTLIAFSIAVTGRQYIGDPIDCISKDDIPTELLDTYCWIHTTFSVESAWFKKVGEEIPYPGVDKFTPGENRVYHAYYQWVCFVLFLQAMLFYIPRYLWKNIEAHKVQNLVMKFNSPVVSAEKKKKKKEDKKKKEGEENEETKKDKEETTKKEGEENEETKKDEAKDSEETKKKEGEGKEMTKKDKEEDELDDNEDTVLLVNYLFENKTYHYFYALSYYVIILLNFINVVGQIFLMDTFLGGEFTTYGTKVLAFSEWDYSLRYDPMIRVFPRMTKCTFHRYGSSGDVQKHDAMCLIPINILNEKIYIFLWFWFIILAALTGLELLYLTAVMLCERLQYLVIRNKCRKVDEDDLKWVMDQMDRYDWVVLNMLCDNLTPCNFKIVIRDLAVRMELEGKPSEAIRNKLVQKRIMKQQSENDKKRLEEGQWNWRMQQPSLPENPEKQALLKKENFKSV